MWDASFHVSIFPSLTPILCPPYLEIRSIGADLMSVSNAVMGSRRRFLKRGLLWETCGRDVWATSACLFSTNYSERAWAGSKLSDPD